MLVLRKDSMARNDWSVFWNGGFVLELADVAWQIDQDQNVDLHESIQKIWRHGTRTQIHQLRQALIILNVHYNGGEMLVCDDYKLEGTYIHVVK